MALSNMVYALKQENELLAYLRTELAAGRWITNVPGAFFAATDRGFGSSSVSQAVADGHRLYAVQTSDTNRLAVDNTDAVNNVNLLLDVAEADWQAALDVEVAAGREPVLQWIEFDRAGQRFFNAVTYVIT